MLPFAKIEYYCISLLFLLLPLDMLTGILLNNSIVLPISISQVYKVLIMGLFLCRLAFVPRKFIVVFLLFVILLVPSIYQIFKQGAFGFIFSDTIKISKYILPLLSFLFFAGIFKSDNLKNQLLVFNLFKFSYIVLIISVYAKFIGFGYPMYKHGNIGSRGFFHAGNELSVLLLVLSSVLAYQLWVQKKNKEYYLFLLLNLITGIVLSSKTGILGVVLVFFLIPLKLPTKTLNKKKFKVALSLIVFVLPLVMLVSWQAIKSSSIYLRFSFFWEKLDLLTFILSTRNVFAAKSFEVYHTEYDYFEKIIGVGQTQFEYLNDNKIIEIDALDIFFAYGFLGLLLFILLSIYIIMQVSALRKKPTKYPFATFVYLMIFIFLGISTVAGHVFNSGLAGIFLGILFALMFKRTYDKEEGNTVL